MVNNGSYVKSNDFSFNVTYKTCTSTQLPSRAYHFLKKKVSEKDDYSEQEEMKYPLSFQQTTS